MTDTTRHYSASTAKLLVSLLLAVVYLLAGFSILMVSSWFIAACSVAGLGFNYMLPAVVIRALAIIRIGSGYLSMLVGHSHLLGKLASIRLSIFADLHNKVSVSRAQSLDVLHHQSEAIAAIWMSWVGQNAGAFLSLLALNVLCVYLVPELGDIVYVFTAVFLLIYAALLAAMAYQSAQMIALKKKLQFDIVKHIEAAPLWHLYPDYEQSIPATGSLQSVEGVLAKRIRTASFLLFVGAMLAVSSIFFFYSLELAGNALFIFVPVALLSMNDWLAPTLVNQKQLLGYIEAKKAIQDSGMQLEGLNTRNGKIENIALRSFKAVNTHMPALDITFELNTTSVLVGSSGAGKSRFLQALCGLLSFQGERHVVIDGNSFTAQALLSDSFYLQQFPYVLSDTLAENLRVVNRNVSDSRLRATLKQVGLGHLDNLDQWLGEHGLPLSGGEIKRLGLARALLSEATLLLLDEPFESLDAQNIDRVARIINGLASQKLVVLATHILPPGLQYQQRISLDPVSPHGGAVSDKSLCS